MANIIICIVTHYTCIVTYLKCTMSRILDVFNLIVFINIVQIHFRMICDYFNPFPVMDINFRTSVFGYGPARLAEKQSGLCVFISRKIQLGL